MVAFLQKEAPETLLGAQKSLCAKRARAPIINSNRASAERRLSLSSIARLYRARQASLTCPLCLLAHARPPARRDVWRTRARSKFMVNIYANGRDRARRKRAPSARAIILKRERISARASERAQRPAEFDRRHSKALLARCRDSLARLFGKLACRRSRLGFARSRRASLVTNHRNVCPKRSPFGRQMARTLAGARSGRHIGAGCAARRSAAPQMRAPTLKMQLRCVCATSSPPTASAPPAQTAIAPA